MRMHWVLLIAFVLAAACSTTPPHEKVAPPPHIVQEKPSALEEAESPPAPLQEEVPLIEERPEVVETPLETIPERPDLDRLAALERRVAELEAAITKARKELEETRACIANSPLQQRLAKKRTAIEEAPRKLEHDLSKLERVFEGGGR